MAKKKKAKRKEPEQVIVPVPVPMPSPVMVSSEDNGSVHASLHVNLPRVDTSRNSADAALEKLLGGKRA